MTNINIKQLTEELIQLCDNLPSGEILDTFGTQLVFNTLYEANRNNFTELLLDVRERELNELKDANRTQRQGNHYASCAIQQFTKSKTEFVSNDIPLLFPIILANYPNGIQGHSESEKKFYEKFKQSFLKHRIGFSNSWLKTYHYDTVVKQFDTNI
jgi:hypothetical protein